MGTILEEIEREMAKIFRILEERNNKKEVKHGEELAREGEEEGLKDEKIIFCLR